MALHFVFRVQGEEYKGMRMHNGLYSAIISTVEHYDEKNFPILLADNTFKKRKINAENIRDFKEELSKAGKIILKHKLLNYTEINRKQEIALENKFTTHEAAVHLATAIELCDICSEEYKGINLAPETASPAHMNLTLEHTINSRLWQWAYSPSAESVLDYKKAD